MQPNLFDHAIPGSDKTIAVESEGGKIKGNYEYNSDGYSIKGCTYIYAPKGQAGEYARLTTNPYRGCTHACRYCYVPLVLKMPREEFDARAVPRPDFLKHLVSDAKKYQSFGSQEQVMLSFTTDPFQDYDRSLTRPTIQIIKDHGMAFCTLTKGGSRALEYLDMFRPDRDAFASTLTSLDDKFSKLWETKAALPQDRIDTLKKFHESGIFTWVSCEPVLDVEATLKIIELTHPFVDFFKIGRVNYIGLTKTTDWPDFTHRVIDLCQRLQIRHYVKRDLQPFLPDGYPNEYIPVQHH